MYIFHIFFIHSFVNGHFSYFHTLAIVNSAAMNIGVHVSFWFMVFSGYMSSSGIAGSYGSFIPRFLRNLHAVLKVAISIHTLNEILLSLKKEWSWVSWTKVDKPRACYTGWSKSERETQLYITIHIWNLEKWYWWSY